MRLSVVMPLCIAATFLQGGCSGEPESAPSDQTVFEKTVEPAAVSELCFESEQGDVVIYRFEADAPLGFNLHYHIDEEVYYPVPEYSTNAAKGQYIVPLNQTYCLMWTNEADTPVRLSTEVNGAGAITWY